MTAHDVLLVGGGSGGSATSIGTGHSSAYKYQEASFFGNIFASPPIAHYCVGKDYAPKSWPGTNASVR